MDTDLFESIKSFLPPYLSPQDKRALFSELSSFPDVFHCYVVQMNVQHLLQGDAWAALPIVNIETLETKAVKGVILSNTCDIAQENASDRRRKIVFCPIASLQRYRENLLQHKNEDAVENIISAIKKQEITYLFYLPEGGNLEEDCIVFLDDVYSVFLDSYQVDEGNKVFELSRLGHFLLLLKISIHFTRFQEGDIRNGNLARASPVTP